MNALDKQTTNIKNTNLNEVGPIRIIDSNDLREFVDMKNAIGLMSLAFSSFSTGQCFVPPRYVTDIPEKPLTLIIKPAHMEKLGCVGIKILNQNEHCGDSRFPTIMGIYLLMEGETGQILSLIDGSYLTALRTGAASGIATDYLARKDAENLAIFGCGVQGRTQLEAIANVRNISKVYIYDRDVIARDNFRKEMQKKFDLKITPVDDLDQLKKVDIICTCTNSRSPLFSMKHIREGVHINAIGSYKPHMQEIDPGIIRTGRLFVDSIDSCMRESGDIIIPIKDNIIQENHIIGEIGNVINGNLKGRETNRDITVFKSVGLAIQDLVVANEAYRKITGNLE